MSNVIPTEDARSALLGLLHILPRDRSWTKARRDAYMRAFEFALDLCVPIDEPVKAEEDMTPHIEALADVLQIDPERLAAALHGRSLALVAVTTISPGARCTFEGCKFAVE